MALDTWNIRSVGHINYTIKSERVVLNSYDDKRFISQDGIHTLAYGHYKLKDEQFKMNY